LRNIEGPFSFEFGSLLDELDRNFGCAILTKYEERLSIVGRVLLVYLLANLDHFHFDV